MPHEFLLPDLGEGITEVEIRKWLVNEGDRVAEHQAVLEVETDKASRQIVKTIVGAKPKAALLAELADYL